MSFSSTNRSETLNNLNSQTSSQIFDLLIVGGGINGAGVARDAALRGMKVALVEKSDFSSGTSSRSSKLVHGGIRYLENFEFHLVFEALSERAKLFALAPHLVHPLRFLIPIYKQSRVSFFKMGLGMWVYDALSFFQAPELHEALRTPGTLERMPQLNSKDLLGSYVYSDAYMDDDRLVHETLRSADKAGARIINFCQAAAGNFDPENKINKVEITEGLTGKKFIIQARHVVSTVGPWTDIFAQELVDSSTSKWKKVLRPTKGIHLTFSQEKLPISAALVMGAETRIVFAIPRNGIVIVGTTDTDYSENPDSVVADKSDVDYVLQVAQSYFPTANLQLSDVISCYAGVRPLVQDEAASEGKTSREHTIWTHSTGVTFVAGGKYTTYRKIAEDVVKHVLHQFPIEDQIRFKDSQSEQPLNPHVTLETYDWTAEKRDRLRLETGYSESENHQLFERFGDEIFDFAKNYKSPSSLGLEVKIAIHHTMCSRIEDFFLRRVPLFLNRRDHGLSELDLVAKIFQAELSLSDAEIEKQKTQFILRIETEMAWKTEHSLR